MTVPPTHERELTAPALLCDAQGRLLGESVGWSRTPLHRCDLPAGLQRKKRWNYWCVTDGHTLLSATIADIDFVALAFVYVWDAPTGYFAEKTAICPGGGVVLPETPAGDIVFDNPAMRVALLDEHGGTRIRIECADFRGQPLAADVLCTRPAGHETLNVVVPWNDTEFQFTSKQNCLPASGTVAIGGMKRAFGDSAYGVLDYGRGVWPHETRWNWGAASGVQGGHTVGLNLGGQWTDGTGMTENGICVDGRLTKIGEDLRFEYDRADMMRPWRVATQGSDRIALEFVPVYERVAKTDGGAYMSEVHQVFGHYAGTVIADGAGPIEVRQMFGWIEDHAARW